MSYGYLHWIVVLLLSGLLAAALLICWLGIQQIRTGKLYKTASVELLAAQGGPENLAKRRGRATLFAGIAFLMAVALAIWLKRF